MKKRNCTIDLMKFGMAIIIAFFHFYTATQKHLIGGFFAVEFFLLAASLFFFSKIDRETEQRSSIPSEGSHIYIYIYIRNRFMRLFPWTFSAFIFTLLLIGFAPSSNENVLDTLVDQLSEIFLIKMNGIANGVAVLNAPTWTLSSMLFVEFILYYFWTRHQKTLTEFVVPLSIVFGIGIWFDCSLGFSVKQNLRVWMVYCAGYLSFRFAKRIKETSFNLRGRITLTVIEIAGYVTAVLIMMARSNLYYQWTCTAIMAVSVAISFSGVSLVEQFLSNKLLAKVCECLGKLSLSVYLLHWGIYQAFISRFPDPETRYSYKWYFLLCFISCAVLQLIIIPPCVKVIKKLWTRTKLALTSKGTSD